jgi:hypothetical protein
MKWGAFVRSPLDNATKGLHVTCRLDRRKYPTGRKVTDEEIKQVNLKPNTFHGDWNYIIHPGRKNSS